VITIPPQVYGTFGKYRIEHEERNDIRPVWTKKVFIGGLICALIGLITSVFGFGYVLMLALTNPDAPLPEFLGYLLLANFVLICASLIAPVINKYCVFKEHGVRVSLIDTETNQVCITEDYILTGNPAIDEGNINQILIGFEVLTT
jgi:hypothetical protein